VGEIILYKLIWGGNDEKMVILGKWDDIAENKIEIGMD
jgi:hypothetical protein